MSTVPAGLGRGDHDGIDGGTRRARARRAAGGPGEGLWDVLGHVAGLQDSVRPRVGGRPAGEGLDEDDGRDERRPDTVADQDLDEGRRLWGASGEAGERPGVQDERRLADTRSAEDPTPVSLDERQQRLCTESRWDFGDLRAVFLNCTLKATPELSHTQGLADVAIAVMEANGVTVEVRRPVDYDLPPGVQPDMTGHGRPGTVLPRPGLGEPRE